MTDPSLFLKSVAIGATVAAPVGPMSLLCMRTTLTRGPRSGLAIGAGIAVGDGIYGAVAAFGLVSLSAFMLAHERPLHLAAGLFLIWLGLKAVWRRDTGNEAAPGASGKGWGRDFASSILLTLTNPPTIIMFSAVFSALTPAGGLRFRDAAMTVSGVFCGSLLWWCGVIAAVSMLHHAFGQRVRLWVGRLSGVVLAALGIVEVRRGLAG